MAHLPDLSQLAFMRLEYRQRGLGNAKCFLRYCRRQAILPKLGNDYPLGGDGLAAFRNMTVRHFESGFLGHTGKIDRKPSSRLWRLRHNTGLIISGPTCCPMQIPAAFALFTNSKADAVDDGSPMMLAVK
jgi:hypothetical protein